MGPAAEPVLKAEFLGKGRDCAGAGARVRVRVRVRVTAFIQDRVRDEEQE
jgi:hypothetical protein